MTINRFFLNSIVFAGDYLLYVYLVVPVGFFINLIGTENPSNFMLVIFFIYMFFLSFLLQQYNLITQRIIKNSFFKAEIIFDTVFGNKNIFNKIYLFLSMNFILTFGFFLEENYNFLYLLFVVSSYIYFLFAIKYNEFITFLIYILFSVICIYFTFFYFLYASLFLYLIAVFYILKFLNEKEINDFNIR